MKKIIKLGILSSLVSLPILGIAISCGNNEKEKPTPKPPKPTPKPTPVDYQLIVNDVSKKVSDYFDKKTINIPKEIKENKKDGKEKAIDFIKKELEKSKIDFKNSKIEIDLLNLEQYSKIDKIKVKFSLHNKNSSSLIKTKWEDWLEYPKEFDITNQEKSYNKLSDKYNDFYEKYLIEYFENEYSKYMEGQENAFHKIRKITKEIIWHDKLLTFRRDHSMEKKFTTYLGITGQLFEQWNKEKLKKEEGVANWWQWSGKYLPEYQNLRYFYKLKYDSCVNWPKVETEEGKRYGTLFTDKEGYYSPPMDWIGKDYLDLNESWDFLCKKIKKINSEGKWKISVNEYDIKDHKWDLANIKKGLKLDFHSNNGEIKNLGKIYWKKVWKYYILEKKKSK